MVRCQTRLILAVDFGLGGHSFRIYPFRFIWLCLLRFCHATKFLESSGYKSSVFFSTNSFNFFVVPLKVTFVINSPSNLIFVPVIVLAVLDVFCIQLNLHFSYKHIRSETMHNVSAHQLLRHTLPITADI